MKRITTLTGPSCAGKSTLESMMERRGCMKAVSTTTRAARAGEKEGVDYYFVSANAFDIMNNCGAFVECVQFGEHWYGLSTAELERLFTGGDHIVLVCEPVGAKQVAKYCRSRPDILLRSIFVDNPESVISDRFLKRAFDDMLAALREGDGSHQRVKAAYAKRLQIMTTIERGWIAEAHGDAHPNRRPLHAIDHLAFKYDVLLDRFDETNAEDVTCLLTEAETVA